MHFFPSLFCGRAAKACFCAAEPHVKQQSCHSCNKRMWMNALWMLWYKFNNNSLSICIKNSCVTIPKILILFYFYYRGPLIRYHIDNLWYHKYIVMISYWWSIVLRGDISRLTRCTSITTGSEVNFPRIFCTLCRHTVDILIRIGRFTTHETFQIYIRKRNRDVRLL